MLLVTSNKTDLLKEGMKAVLGKDLGGKKYLGDANVLGARQWRHEVKSFMSKVMKFALSDTTDCSRWTERQYWL